MKKILWQPFAYLVGILLAINGMADTPPILNTINYQQQLQTWVATDSALLTVSVHITTQQQTFGDLQQQMTTKLKHISADHQWHINHFMTSQDQSGLQQLSWQLSARLPLTIVNQLRSKIDSLSQAGQQYKILSIDFAPSLQEKQKAYAQLRQHIYQQVQAELITLNKDFSPTHYFLHRIDFNHSTSLPSPLPMTALLQIPKAAQQPAATMGSELMLMANIQLAAVQ